MEYSKFLIFALAIYVVFSPASSQITTPCTPSMITTFTPCISFVTNSTQNGTSPTSDCCNSLKSLMSTGKDCLCLIATGSVPFSLPINRTLAISLPRACNSPAGIPLQCKAAGAPVPAPGPVANGPALSPNAAPSPSITELAPPEPLSPRSSPGGNETPATNVGPPTSTTGSRAGVTPSAADPSYMVSSLNLITVIAAIALKYY